MLSGLVIYNVGFFIATGVFRNEKDVLKYSSLWFISLPYVMWREFHVRRK